MRQFLSAQITEHDGQLGKDKYRDVNLLCPWHWLPCL